MKIAVCGWYFDEDLYASLWRLNEKYPVFIIAHREDELLKYCDLPWILTDNFGLEWGAYNHYIRYIWDGNDSVLFMHDDIKLQPIIQNYEIKPGELAFNYLSQIEYDQSYIFQNRREDVLNFGQHGRMVFMSERLLKLLKKDGDLPFDKKNSGYTGEINKPKDVEFYNYGIKKVNEKFKDLQQRRPGWLLLRKVYVPSIDMGYRGKFGNQKESFMSHLGMSL